MKSKFLKALSWAVFPALLVGGFAIASSDDGAATGQGNDMIEVCESTSAGAHSGDFRMSWDELPDDLREAPQDAVDVPLEALPDGPPKDAPDVVDIAVGDRTGAC